MVTGLENFIIGFVLLLLVFTRCCKSSTKSTADLQQPSQPMRSVDRLAEDDDLSPERNPKGTEGHNVSFQL